MEKWNEFTNNITKDAALKSNMFRGITITHARLIIDDKIGEWIKVNRIA